MFADDRIIQVLKSQDVLTTDLGDATVSGAGALMPATAEKFFSRLIVEGELAKIVSVDMMRSYKQELPATKLGGQFLMAGNEAAALSLGDAMKPTFTQPELNAKLFRGIIELSDEALEDNIQRKTLVDKLLNELPAAAARDMDDIALNGDTTTAKTSARNRALAQLDGIIAGITTNTKDGGGLLIDQSMLRDTMAALPVEYKSDKVIPTLRFLVPSQAKLSYVDTYSRRMTPGGDEGQNVGWEPKYIGKVGLIGVGMMTSTPASSTVGILCDPKNIHLGIWRQVRLETFRDPRAGMNYIICSVRFDVAIQDELACAKLTNFKVAA